MTLKGQPVPVSFHHDLSPRIHPNQFAFLPSKLLIFYCCQNKDQRIDCGRGLWAKSDIIKDFTQKIFSASRKLFSSEQRRPENVIT